MLIITVQTSSRKAKLLTSIVEEAVKKIDPGADVSAEKHKPATSRSARFSDAQSTIADAKSEMESLREELQTWRDNLPENLQSGTKADELDSAISELEDVISSLEEAESASVEFPGMY